MRILVADQNALLLTAITVTFGEHCDLVTATRRDACITHVQQEKFDVVVACDKMADYTGLELLSEIAALSPGTLLIFAASPECLEQLSDRPRAFSLFDTLVYPITPRHLLDALLLAREHQSSQAERKVPHVVLDPDWDTGERLALVEQELDAEAAGLGGDRIEEADPALHHLETEPLAPVEEAYGGSADAGSLDEDGVEELVFAEAPLFTQPATTDEAALASEPAAPTHAVPALGEPAPTAALAPATPTLAVPASAKSASAAPASASAPATQSAPRPRARVQSVPSESQRAAFERARARRNAQRAGITADSATEPVSHKRPEGGAAENQRASAGSMFTGPGLASSQSLSDLARMATKKRPLGITLPGKAIPKRAAFAVGSGLVAVTLVGILSFELFKSNAAATEQQRRPAPVTSADFWGAAQQGGQATPLVPPTADAGPQGTAGTEPPQSDQDSQDAVPNPNPAPPPEFVPPDQAEHTGPPQGMLLDSGPGGGGIGGPE